MTKRNGIYAEEFTHRSIRIPPSPELDATRTVCFTIHGYSGLTVTEFQPATSGNKITKSGIQTSPSA